MKHVVLALCLCFAPTLAMAEVAVAPLIDVHLHDHGAVPPAMRERVAVTVMSVTTREGFRTDAGIAGTVLRGPAFPCHAGRIRNEAPCFPESDGWPDIKWLRAEHAAGRLHSLGELLYVYAGIDPADPRLAPYFALAEELDLPVGVHVGRGPPPDRRPPGCCPDFNDDLGDPLRLAPVLQRHPRLRLYLMHVPGWDYVDQTIALMHAWPGVYAEASVVNSVVPPEAHAAAVRRLFDEGLGHRLMLGSDNVPLDRIVARIEALDFLDEAQKRGILHDNAARFLRLPDPAGRYTHRFAPSGDARIHYLDFGAKGDGVPLVFLQSFHGDALEWVDYDAVGFAPRLGQERRVLAITRRGWGASSETGGGYDTATQARDALAVLDHAGIGKAVFVGRIPANQDMAWIAENHPGRVAGLVFIGDPMVLPRIEDPEAREAMENIWRLACDLGDEAVERTAPRTWRPAFLDDPERRIDLPALRLVMPHRGPRELAWLDGSLAWALDENSPPCNSDARAYFRALADDPGRAARVREVFAAADPAPAMDLAMRRAFADRLVTVEETRFDPEQGLGRWEQAIREFMAGLGEAD